MIDIYICEDNRAEREQIADYVQKTIVIHEYDMKLKMTTGNPDELTEALKQSDATGLYFLDIDLHGNKNGLVLAKEIREYDPRGFIVFITSHSEMSFMTFQYKVEALDFILKDEPKLLQQRISECIEQVNRRYTNISRGAEKTLTINRGGRKITLSYNEIMFFETSVNEHKLIVHTLNKSIEFFGKMKEIETEVGDEFIRCHRAYLVNRRNIKEVSSSERVIVMKNQAICPISFRMLGQVKMIKTR